MKLRIIYQGPTFIVLLNYLQLYHVQNLSEKVSGIHGFLSVQQLQLKNH
jgi:hypothetical protein